MSLAYTRRVEAIISPSTGQNYTGGGTNYLIETPNGTLYLVFINNLFDVYFRKSEDRGISWSVGTAVFTGTTTALSVWYDRWSGISAGLIHCAYQESDTDDTLYRTINTESSDALSTQTTIFAGMSTASGGQLTIARARGGNVYCRTCIDAGAEGGFYKLANADVPTGSWSSVTNNETLATTDQMILLPGWASDNQDMMAFFWDASSDEISRQLYDDSANTWSETSIATSMTDRGASTDFPHFAAAVDIANSRNLLVAWSAVDTANADLRCWHVTESAITEVTNVITNSTDDQGFAGISINTVTGYWTVAYAGKTDGSETFATDVNIYYKTSQDSGSTWGSETKINNHVENTLGWLIVCPRTTLPIICVTAYGGGGVPIKYFTEIPSVHATYQLGI